MADGAELAGALETDAPRGPSEREIWFWGLCIFLLTSPFVYQLTGIDPSREIARDMSTMRRTEGSGVLLYVLRVAVALAAMLSVAPYWRTAVTRLSRMTPILLFAGWATLSLMWTDTFSSTLNGLFALFPLIITGFCLALRLPPHLFARSFVYAGAFMIGFSLIYIFAMPHFGVHQQSDAAQSVHAGAWRGVYPHKNIFGGMCAAYAVTTMLAGRKVLPSIVFRIVQFALLMVMIVKSDSATALAIVAATPFVVGAVLMTNAIQRTILALVIVPMFIVIYSQLETILGLFGRDMTFTGRTSIWEIAPDAIAKRPLTGFGYASTTYGDFMVELFRRFALFDPHNGYLNIILSTGFIGLLLFVATFVTAAIVARRMYLVGGATRAAAFTSFGIIVAWLIAMFSESQDKPLGAFAALAYTSLGLLVYRNFAPAEEEVPGVGGIAEKPPKSYRLGKGARISTDPVPAIASSR
ncbi:O-antigen ligase [Sphingomonas sp.]|uniref:O-antigen ligase family protein n=1 Tax=Sphingomonas sp. TaxID=28214 RepID=UPI0025E66C74|nr:O-antigen ligase [Sphingomonas sp.]